MPETGEDISLGTDLSALVAGGPPKDVTEGLSALYEQKGIATSRISGDTDRQVTHDQHQVETAYHAEGAGPEQLKPWNQEEESKKFHTSPLDAFGSLGSVFGILASAFTHAPMENSMNASAAAMNAIRAGDDKEYERAHTAWKENNDLVVKRHNMMHEAYTDAITLMKTNMAAGQAKLQNLAYRFGDQKALFLLEHGMDKELIELTDARNKQVLGMSDAMEKITKSAVQKRMLESDPQWLGDGEDNPQKKAAGQLAAFNRIYGADKKTPQQTILGQYIYEHPQATAEEVADFADKHGIIRQYGTTVTGTKNDAVEINRRATEYETNPDSETYGDHGASYDRAKSEVSAAGKPAPKKTPQQTIIDKYLEEHPDASAEDIAEFSKKQGIIKDPATAGKAGGNTTLTTERQIAAAAARKRAEVLDSGGSPEEADKQAMEYASKLKREASAPSGNKIDALKSRDNQIKYSVETIDKIEAALKKAKALTGLGGKILRPAESIASLFGSNSTEYHEMESMISELKEWAPRILTDSQGRPLSAETANLDKIIRGLNLGDTTNITAQRLLEVRKLYQEMQKDTRGRISGGKTDTAEPPATASSTTPAWKSAPLVGGQDAR